MLKHHHHYFQSCATWLIGNNTQPYIIVDWSCLTPCGKFHFLRASIPVGGRALPILDMAFTIKDYASPKAHALFLETLKTILPTGCRPIVITHSGFLFGHDYTMAYSVATARLFRLYFLNFNSVIEQHPLTLRYYESIKQRASFCAIFKNNF